MSTFISGVGGCTYPSLILFIPLPLSILPLTPDSFLQFSFSYLWHTRVTFPVGGWHTGHMTHLHSLPHLLSLPLLPGLSRPLSRLQKISLFPVSFKSIIRKTTHRHTSYFNFSSQGLISFAQVWVTVNLASAEFLPFFLSVLRAKFYWEYVKILGDAAAVRIWDSEGHFFWSAHIAKHLCFEDGNSQLIHYLSLTTELLIKIGI